MHAWHSRSHQPPMVVSLRLVRAVCERRKLLHALIVHAYRLKCSAGLGGDEADKATGDNTVKGRGTIITIISPRSVSRAGHASRSS